MNRRQLAVVVVLIVVALVLGFASGSSVEHLRAGHYYEVRSEKEYPSAFGTITLRYVTDTIGLPFVDPGTCVVSLRDHTNWEFQLYKAKRVFQENRPFVNDLVVEQDGLRWEDGIFRYALHIEKLSEPADR
jgi:hypothetical protein